jgi:signal transduction histidine kinase
MMLRTSRLHKTSQGEAARIRATGTQEKVGPFITIRAINLLRQLRMLFQQRTGGAGAAAIALRARSFQSVSTCHYALDLLRYAGKMADMSERSNSKAHGLTSFERLNALASLRLMDSQSEEIFDRYTRLATAILKCPISLMSLVDDRRQFFKSKAGLPEEMHQTPLSHSFCQHVVVADKPLIIADARDEPLVMHNLAIADLGVIAYLGVPIHSQDGHVLGSFCAIDKKPRKWSVADLNTMQDLVYSIETELSLRDRNAVMVDLLKENERAEQDRELMTRMLIHDMRNPLNPIYALIDLLKERKDLTPIESRMLSLADAGMQSLLEMIEQVLEVYRMREGKLILETSSFQLAKLLREVYLQTLPLAESMHQSIKVVYPDTRLSIRADRGLMRRILLNLITNATKYAGANARIRIGAESTSSGCCLWVEDNGPGIPQQQRDGIFNAFDRGGQAGSAKRSSFGLGLAFCKLATEAHGGSISLVDTADGFHRFLVELPHKP